VRFPDEENAIAWFERDGGDLEGTTLVASGLNDPVWWPTELSAQRPEWSRKAEPPPYGLGSVVCVWAELTDPATFLDYAEHFRWTVEMDGGCNLAAGARPRILHGGPGPHAIALMGWPRNAAVRKAWYHGEHYRPYKEQRQRSSNCTIVSVETLWAEHE
jgi:uncharacterized protein (DUF1330 family)